MDSPEWIARNVERLYGVVTVTPTTRSIGAARRTAKSTTKSANRKHRGDADPHNVTEFNNQRARARAIELTRDYSAVSELCLAAENARDFPADRSNRAVSWTNARPARSSIMVTDRKLGRTVQ